MLTLATLRRLNIVLCAVGMVLFSGSAIYIGLFPEDFDRRVHDVVLAKVTQKMPALLVATLSPNKAGPMQDLLAPLGSRISREVERVAQNLGGQLGDFVTNVVEADCADPCAEATGPRAQAVQEAGRFFRAHLSALPLSEARLRAAIIDLYRRHMAVVRRDFVIFSASNAAAFAVALALSLVRPRTERQLLLVSLSLSAATLVTTAWYLSGWDPILAFVYNDVVGWAYLGYLATIGTIFADIAINRGRITTMLANRLAHLASVVLSALPR
ncbi:MAG: hypothetical protein U1E48_09170 [Paracoccaceae bacterium]